MTTAKLEALLRNIIQHRRLPFTFHSVSAATNGWHIVVCDADGATLLLTVPAGRPLDVRNAIQERLKPPSKTPHSARLPSPDSLDSTLRYQIRGPAHQRCQALRSGEEGDVATVAGARPDPIPRSGEPATSTSISRQGLLGLIGGLRGEIDGAADYHCQPWVFSRACCRTEHEPSSPTSAGG